MCHLGCRKLISLQVDNLRERAGVETIFFTTRGTTNLPLRNVGFSTPGVKNFLDTVMKIDQNDFLGRMEGFAVQGMKGM